MPTQLKTVSLIQSNEVSSTKAEQGHKNIPSPTPKGHKAIPSPTDNGHQAIPTDKGHRVIQSPTDKGHKALPCPTANGHKAIPCPTANGHKAIPCPAANGHTAIPSSNAKDQVPRTQHVAKGHHACKSRAKRDHAPLKRYHDQEQLPWLERRIEPRSDLRVEVALCVNGLFPKGAYKLDGESPLRQVLGPVPDLENLYGFDQLMAVTSQQEYIKPKPRFQEPLQEMASKALTSDPGSYPTGSNKRSSPSSAVDPMAIPAVAPMAVPAAQGCSQPRSNGPQPKRPCPYLFKPGEVIYRNPVMDEILKHMK